LSNRDLVRRRAPKAHRPTEIACQTKRSGVNPRTPRPVSKAEPDGRGSDSDLSREAIDRGPFRECPREAFIVSYAGDCHPQGRDFLARRAQHVKPGPHQRACPSSGLCFLPHHTNPVLLRPYRAGRPPPPKRLRAGKSAHGCRCQGTPPLSCGRTRCIRLLRRKGLRQKAAIGAVKRWRKRCLSIGSA
jgi:hypothetical protein